ncbi:T9SS type A sorting domain-containing protein [Psychroserpens sp.]|uniref:T9SS type A sorting domain-containing protein n=1 Tax=Psychroserpens sp. TaxID=2020870 RepID=UPI003C782923
MKTKLLLLALFTTAFGFSQMHDNIPTGTGNYINKLIISPSGDDLINEYIEVRGTANAVIPSDLYLISIEGDGNSSSLGQVEEAIQLGDGTRTFGANGMLVVICNYTQDSGGSTSLENLDGFYPSPYINLISADATIIEIALTGNDLGSSSSSAVSSSVPDIGYDGNFIDATGTYMLISSPTNPKDVYIDGPNSGEGLDADGVIDTSGDHILWTLFDSITYMDDNDEGSEEFGYAQIIYAQQNGINSAVQNTTTSATVVNFDSTSDANYLLRQGTKTGYAASDWIVAGNGSGSVPDWEFSTTDSKVYPMVFVGYSDLNTIYGELNPTEETLATGQFLVSNFDVFPNPANEYINIESGQTDISSIVIYNILGKQVLKQNELTENRINISTLNSGIYIMKINAAGNSITKKIIVK